MKEPSYQSACQPCNVPFDFLTKTETAGMDSEFILQQMNSEFSHIGRILGQYSSTNMDYEHYISKLQKIYENVPKKLVKILYDIFELDFEMFGYDISPFL